jgi:excisionase family DNA binding protein
MAEEELYKMRMVVECALTPEEAARFLNVKTQTVYLWASQRKIPCYKIAGWSLRFKLSELEAWLERQKQPVAEVYQT